MKIERSSPETIKVTVANSNLEAVSIIPTLTALDVCPEHDRRPEYVDVRAKVIKLREKWREAIFEIRLLSLE